MLEFNCRLGDPETQPILMRLESDLVALCGAAIEGSLAGVRREVGCARRARSRDGRRRISRPLPHGRSDLAGWMPPQRFPEGIPRRHARERRAVLTAGGRVLCAVGLGECIAAAQRRGLRARSCDPLGRRAVSGATSAGVRSAPHPANSVAEYGETRDLSLRIIGASQSLPGET